MDKTLKVGASILISISGSAGLAVATSIVTSTVAPTIAGSTTRATNLPTGTLWESGNYETCSEPLLVFYAYSEFTDENKPDDSTGEDSRDPAGEETEDTAEADASYFVAYGEYWDACDAAAYKNYKVTSSGSSYHYWLLTQDYGTISFGIEDTKNWDQLDHESEPLVTHITPTKTGTQNIFIGLMNTPQCGPLTSFDVNYLQTWAEHSLCEETGYNSSGYRYSNPVIDDFSIVTSSTSADLAWGTNWVTVYPRSGVIKSG